MSTNKNSHPSNESDRDEERMVESGAKESGYHAPTAEDIRDIEKDHETSSVPGGMNADSAMRSDEPVIKVGDSRRENEPSEDLEDSLSA